MKLSRLISEDIHPISVDEGEVDGRSRTFKLYLLNPSDANTLKIQLNRQGSTIPNRGKFPNGLEYEQHDIESANKWDTNFVVWGNDLNNKVVRNRNSDEIGVLTGRTKERSSRSPLSQVLWATRYGFNYFPQPSLLPLSI